MQDKNTIMQLDIFGGQHPAEIIPRPKPKPTELELFILREKRRGRRDSQFIKNLEQAGVAWPELFPNTK